MGEVDLAGVLLPPLLVWLGIALLLCAALRRALLALNFYRFVWHRPLFDFLLTLVLLGAVSFCASHLNH